MVCRTWSAVSLMDGIAFSLCACYIGLNGLNLDWETDLAFPSAPRSSLSGKLYSYRAWLDLFFS